MLDMEARGVNPARIALIGLGGGGSNAVNRMVTEGLRDVVFWVANTDAQALDHSVCKNRIHLGMTLTAGTGAGGDPDVGRRAAEEDRTTLTEVLEGHDMVFVTAGMGGGTGTGAAPVVAEIARSLGALTVAIVTRPFSFEGSLRSRRAEEGIKLLAEEVDTLIVIPNDKLLHLVDRAANLQAGLRVADEVLFQATRGISDIITGNGLINVDFADVKTVMRNRGSALLGYGIANGANRALEASQSAISSPLLDDLSIDGASAILVNVVGGTDMGFHEVTEIGQYISQQAGRECDVFWGAVVDPAISGEVRVTLIATGFQRSPAIRRVERVIPQAAPTQQAAPVTPTVPAAPAPPDLAPTVFAPATVPGGPRIAQEAPLAEPATALHRASDAQPVERETRRIIPFPEAASVPAQEPTPWLGDDGVDGNPEAWIGTPQPEHEEDMTTRGPALWRRSPGRRLRLPGRLESMRGDGRNPLDIPAYLRKQMD